MHLGKVDLNLFVVFDTIYAEGGITRASRRLNLSQPAISHALGRLRQMFDDPLFTRHGHNMTPTPLARRLIEPIRQSLQGLEVALGKLDDRGRMFVKAGDPVYEGMIVGVHSRDNDLVVNAVRMKQLTNFRVSGKEDAIKITPPIDLTLEYGVEFIEDDELVEITPKSVRLRKRFLKEHERKRASREA